MTPKLGVGKGRVGKLGTRGPVRSVRLYSARQLVYCIVERGISEKVWELTKLCSDQRLGTDNKVCSD